MFFKKRKELEKQVEILEREIDNLNYKFTIIVNTLVDLSDVLKERVERENSNIESKASSLV